MPNTFTINLLNQNVASKFAFFQAPPKVKGVQKTSNSGSNSNSGDSTSLIEAKNIFTNVWVAKGCDAGGQISIQVTVDFFGWVGDGTQKAAPGVVVSSGKHLPATLGVDDTPGSTFDISINADGIVTSKPVKDNAPGGTFQLVTLPLTASNGVVIGMCKPDPDNPGFYRPTAVINASGNMIYSLKPVNNFYVAKFDSGSGVGAGKIFDFTTVSNQKGLISFSENPGTNVANVVLDDEGTFQVTYF